MEEEEIINMNNKSCEQNSFVIISGSVFYFTSDEDHWVDELADVCWDELADACFGELADFCFSKNS